jgi:hypothetical protein
MTLKEKLCEPFGGLKTETANELVEIVDEFAIGFAKWYNEILAEDEFKEEKSKELLEIYKKENKL